MNADLANAMDRAGRVESWIALVRRRWLSGASVFMVVLALAAATVFLGRPIHRAQARLRLGEPPPMSGVSPTAGFFGLIRMGGDPFANDLELIASRTLIERVIADVSLHAKLIAPRGWHRDSIFLAFAADSTTRRATYEAEWQSDGGLAIRQLAPTDSAVTVTTAGEPVLFGGINATFRAWREGAPRSVRIQTVPMGLAVINVGPRLRVERARRDANVVLLEFDDADPAVAQAVITSMIDRFIELRTGIQERESRTTVDSLRAVAGMTQIELTAAEDSLESWQRQTRLVQPEIQAAVFAERYGVLLEQVEVGRLELEAIVAITDFLAAAPDSTFDYTMLLAHPRFLENETVGLLLTRLAGLQDQRTELLTRRAATSREVRVVDEQIRVLAESLRAIADNLRSGLADQLVTLESRVSEMDRALAGTPAQAIELGRRQRAVHLLSEIIVLTEQRLRQEELRQALTFSNVQVIDPPALRWKPVWPRRTLGLAVGLMLATGAGLLSLVATERADRRVRRAARIETLLGAPVIAVVVAQRGRAPVLTDAEIRAIARHAADDAGSIRVTSASGDRRAEHHLRALATDGVDPTDRSSHRIIALPPIDGFATAAAAAGPPVVMVVSCGHTRGDRLAHSVHLLRAAGAAVAGAIVVCSHSAQAAAFWT